MEWIASPEHRTSNSEWVGIDQNQQQLSNRKQRFAVPADLRSGELSRRVRNMSSASNCGRKKDLKKWVGNLLQPFSRAAHELLRGSIIFDRCWIRTTKVRGVVAPN
jgi:hypothetical protein